MFNYDGELHLLCETLKKLRIATYFLVPGDYPVFATDLILNAVIDENKNVITEEYINSFSENTVHELKYRLGVSFITLRLPSTSQKTLLFIGPFISEDLTSSKLLELLEKAEINPDAYPVLEKYFLTLPVLDNSSAIYPLLDSFCETIWGKGNYVYIEKYNKDLSSGILHKYKNHGGDFNTAKKLMEERYNAENRLIYAVSKGLKPQGMEMLNIIRDTKFEKRLDDPIRNLKNYSIIMNTLLRKAAEKGGVHPINLDKISSYFAVKIEQLRSTDSVKKIMADMFNEYCDLVKKHRTSHLSETVRIAVLQINSELAGDLSLNTLAKSQNVNASYLSSVFKKETGMTVTDYIAKERIDYAAHLLETTALQIQTVALYCGIVDVQYFSKLFKKLMGKTPKDFRLSLTGE